MGEAPVIYSEELAERTRSNIEQMLRNDGYLHATVDLQCDRDEKKRRAVATYYLHERERYYVSEMNLVTEDKELERMLVADSASSLLKKGMPFRSAYKIVGQIVAECIEKKTVLDKLPLEAYKQHSDMFEADLYSEISLKACVEKRISEGGTSVASVEKQLVLVRKELEK